MFFFIAGIQPRTVLAEQESRSCPACGRFSLQLKRTDHYLAIFFIPLIPVKRGEPFLQCRDCGAAFQPDGVILASPDSRRHPACRSCGKLVEQDFSYCPYCGKSL